MEQKRTLISVIIPSYNRAERKRLHKEQLAAIK